MLRKLSEAEQLIVSDRDRQAFELIKEYSERPSKRIRGSLVVIAHNMFSGANEQDALDVAAAVELIQNYLLIIDDVADRSVIRRASPTLHRIYYETLGDDEVLSEEERVHMSNMLAVHVGLVASHLAGEVMCSLNGDPELTLKANIVFHRNILITGLGQINDIYCPIDRPDEDVLLENLARKSSYYTFVNPMQLGAILADTADYDLTQIREFGLPAGVAFQLQDDAIGLFGDPKSSGKSNLDDLREGKYTLFIQKTLSECSDDERKFILETIGDQDITDKQADRIRDIVRAYDVDEYVKKESAKYATKAKEVLSKQQWAETEKSELTELINSMEERNQ